MWNLIQAILLLVYPIEITSLSGVIDGDTIDTGLGRVRLLGINAPERGERCYMEAKQALEEFLAGEVNMERGIEDRDKYGRLLRHLYTTEWINLKLVQAGVAKSYCLFPNYAYCERLAEAQAEAMNSGRGCLWQPSGNACLVISEVGRQEDTALIRNYCNAPVDLGGVYVESDGRQREYLSGEVCAGCEVSRSIEVGKFVMLFDEWGLIDFRAS